MTVGLLVLPVIAKENSSTMALERAIDKLEKFELPDVESTGSHNQSLFVGPRGQVRIISGEVKSIASSTISVEVWGLTLQVNIGSASFRPKGELASTLKVGDKVNIKGKMNSAGGVDAEVVHNLSRRKAVTDELSAQIRKLIERLRELQLKAGMPLTPLPVATSTTP